ncbi:MAG: SAM-dependent methyltransferase, partial [Pseudomonadota bacterium]|nr:SAM-dependent methyltransferase [Pseudomonadota bacterium]
RFALAGRTFDLVVVTNYLHRPLFGDLRAAVAPGGGLIYETFAAGNEAVGRPRNPDFLLRPGELRAVFNTGFEIMAFEDVTLRSPRPAVVQRLAARRWA